jgi:hypothetical protein
MATFLESAAALLFLALPAMCGAAALAPAAGLPASAGPASLDPCSDFAIAAGSVPDLIVVNGHGRLAVWKKGGRLSATLNGADVPPSRLRREGSILYVRGAAGENLFMIGVFGGFAADGQLAYTPDLDPDSLKGRFGIKVEPASDELASRLSLDARQALVVAKVCAQTPLAPADVIVGVDGRRPATVSLLQRAALGKRAGEELRLSVMRNGRVEEISLVAAPAKPWPTPEELASYLRQVVHD